MGVRRRLPPAALLIAGLAPTGCGPASPPRPPGSETASNVGAVDANGEQAPPVTLTLREGGGTAWAASPPPVVNGVRVFHMANPHDWPTYDEVSYLAVDDQIFLNYQSVAQACNAINDLDEEGDRFQALQAAGAFDAATGINWQDAVWRVLVMEAEPGGAGRLVLKVEAHIAGSNGRLSSAATLAETWSINPDGTGLLLENREVPTGPVPYMIF